MTNIEIAEIILHVCYYLFGVAGGFGLGVWTHQHNPQWFHR